MAYQTITLLDTNQSAESAPVVIARLKRLLVVITLSGAAKVRVVARTAQGNWRELAAMSESGEFSLDNYGWEALCVRFEPKEAQSACLATLSWSEP